MRSFCLMCTSLFLVYALQFVHWVISVRRSVSRLCPLCFDVLFTMHGKNDGMWGRGGIAGGSRQGPSEAHTEGVFGTVYCFLALLPPIVTLVCPPVTFPSSLHYAFWDLTLSAICTHIYSNTCPPYHLRYKLHV